MAVHIKKWCAAIPEHSSQTPLRLRAEIEKLRKGQVAFVDRIEIKESSPSGKLPILIVYTKRIISDPYHKKTYMFGRYRLRFNPNNSSIRMTNLDIKPEHYRYHHPHVCGGGIPCLGHLKDKLPMLVRKLEFWAATSITITFLKKVDGGAWFQDIYNWPQVQQVD